LPLLLVALALVLCSMVYSGRPLLAMAMPLRCTSS
jgi:hypothetical protein